MSIADISKNMGVTQNVSFRVIDRATGQIVSEHVGHNQATNTMLLGIAHYLKGDGVLNQASSMLGDYVPKYISLGTMGLLNQDEDENGLPTGIGETEQRDGESDESYEERRYNDYKEQQPGYGADGYDPSENNGRSQLGLGAVYPGAGVPVKCELISTTFPRSKISYRQIIPETKSEKSETIDIVYSAMISTGALAQFRGDADHIFITEAGLWATPDWRSSTSNGLLAGYRMMPTDTEKWDMTDPENRRLVQESIIRVGINQVVQVIWKIQIGSIYDLIGSAQDLRNYVTHLELEEELTSYVQYEDINGFLKFKGYVDVRQDLPNNAEVYDMYKAIFDGVSYFYNEEEEWELLYDTSASGVGRNTEGQTFTIDDTEYTGGIGSEQFNNYQLNKSVGEYSHAEGYSTTAQGIRSHAEGFGTIASGDTAHAEGASTTASGNFSHAEGSNTTASGLYSHAEGNQTLASGGYSHAEGDGTHATAYYAHAEGDGTTASGNGSHAEGRRTNATKESSHAEGYETVADAKYSHAEGNGTHALGTRSHAEGEATYAYGASSHSEGQSTKAYGISSHAEGKNTETGAVNGSDLTSGLYAHAEGDGSKALSEDSHAEGSGTTASNVAAHAEGWSTEASGAESHAEGLSTKAIGTAAHAEGNGGQWTDANGIVHISGAHEEYSHSEGNQTVANGVASHVEGIRTIAQGAYSHAEGENTIASGAASHAEGKGGSFTLDGSTYTSIAVGINSHSEGCQTAALGDCAHSEGYQTVAAVMYSHSEGYHSKATGNSAHAEGSGTTASGVQSHAGGSNCLSSGACSFSHGENLVAQVAHSAVFGKNNLPNNTDIFQIGNGSSSAVADRSNAIAVDTSGNTRISGRYTDSTGLQLMPIVSLTQAEYDALDPPLQNVMYCIHS